MICFVCLVGWFDDWVDHDRPTYKLDGRLVAGLVGQPVIRSFLYLTDLRTWVDLAKTKPIICCMLANCMEMQKRERELFYLFAFVCVCFVVKFVSLSLL